jgi:hypothetical protein
MMNKSDSHAKAYEENKEFLIIPYTYKAFIPTTIFLKAEE